MAAGAAAGDSASADPVDRAAALFTAGQFQEGLAVIHEALAQDGLSRDQRAQLLQRQAQFYEADVGNMDVADRLRERILALGLADEHPAAVTARANLARREADRRRYRKQDSLLASMRIDPRFLGGLSSREKEDQAARLRELINSHPGYPGRAAAWFYLGENLRELGAYREAVRAYERALEEKPALSIYLPATQRRDLARRHDQRQTAQQAGWGGLAALLCLTAVLFYAARPWRWLRFRHALVLVALVLLWVVFFAFATWWASARVGVPRSGAPPPVYLFTELGAPGSAALGTLFWFGLAGILGLFAVAVGTARLHLGWTRALLNATVGLALFACLLTVFYLRHVDGRGRFEPAEGDRLPLLLGTVYYVIPSIEPYVLTDPLAYPELKLLRAKKPLAEWLAAIRESARQAEVGGRQSDMPTPPDSVAAGTPK
jgi:hypothetical protein